MSVRSRIKDVVWRGDLPQSWELVEKFCNAVVSVLGIQPEVLGVSQIGRWKGKRGAVKDKGNHVDELEPESVSLPPTAATAHLQQKLVPFSIAVFALGLGCEEGAGGDL